MPSRPQLFARRLGEAGVLVVKAPFHAQNANAYAERFVRSIRNQCLNRMIPFRGRHLRWSIAEYVEHIIVSGITKALRTN